MSSVTLLDAQSVQASGSGLHAFRGTLSALGRLVSINVQVDLAGGSPAAGFSESDLPRISIGASDFAVDAADGPAQIPVQQNYHIPLGQDGVSAHEEFLARGEYIYFWLDVPKALASAVTVSVIAAALN